MRIGRWSELSVDSVYQEHEVMRDADANETSGAPNGYSLLVGTKRIQPARGWCATVPQSGGTLCKLYPPTPPLRRPGRPVFWGKPAVRPRSMAGGAPTPCGRHLSPTQDWTSGCLPRE